MTAGYLGMALLGPLFLESASPGLSLGHLACLAVLWRLALQVDPTDAASFGRFYMRVWALFFRRVPAHAGSGARRGLD